NPLWVELSLAEHDAGGQPILNAPDGILLEVRLLPLWSDFDVQPVPDQIELAQQLWLLHRRQQELDRLFLPDFAAEMGVRVGRDRLTDELPALAQPVVRGDIPGHRGAGAAVDQEGAEVGVSRVQRLAAE